MNSSPILVDYDGMYVPALNGKSSSEIGQPELSEPETECPAILARTCSRQLLGWVIAVSLLAISVDPKLWHTFKGGDDCFLP